VPKPSYGVLRRLLVACDTVGAPFINLKYTIRFWDPPNENQNIQKYSEQKIIAYWIVTT
jgi:hypothetical protein